MNWININVSVIDSEEFLGAEPTERATWLCLLRYCCGQENGGRIEDARAWKDRKWQQVVRVTGKEVAAVCDLWSWEGNDLVVSFYPIEKEVEVKTNRLNGSKGGRPSKRKPDGKPTEEAKPQPEQNHPVSDGLPPGFEFVETERKGIEGNRKEEEEDGNSPPRPPTWDEVKAFAQSAPVIISKECTEAFFDEMEATEWTYRGQPCVSRNAWHARFRRFSTNWNQNEQGRGNR